MNYDIVTIGGGITSMWAALAAAKRGLRVAIIAPQFDAGLIGNAERDGFSFDFGGHVYTIKHEPTAELMRDSGAEVHTDRVAYYVHDDGTRIPYPVQDAAGQMGIELRRSGDKPAQRETLADYVRRELGDDFYYRFMLPFNARVWSTHPDNMDSDWVDNRIKLPSQDAKGWGVHYNFMYARGDRILRTMRARLLAAGVEFIGASIVAVNPSSVVTNKEIVIKTSATIDTTREFHQVGRVNRVYTVGIGLTREINDDAYWYYCNLGLEAHRVNIASRYHTSLAPTGKSSLVIEFPKPPTEKPQFLKLMRRNFFAHDYHGWYDMTKREAAFVLGQLGIPSLRGFGERDIETAVLGVCTGYPIPTYGIRDEMAKTKLHYERRNHFFAGRWGSHAYFNLDHCIIDAEVAVGAAMNGSNDAYLNSSFYYAK